MLGATSTGSTFGLYANQTGTNPTILTSSLAHTGTLSANFTKTLILGGTNTADNAFNGAIGNYVNSGFTATVAPTKYGAGTWALGGVNSYTGATTISQGTLKINANAASSTVLSSANAITFNATNNFAGGTLELVGQAGVNNVQALGALTSTQGSNIVRVTPGAGGNASLTFTSLGPW